MSTDSPETQPDAVQTPLTPAAAPPLPPAPVFVPPPPPRSFRRGFGLGAGAGLGAGLVLLVLAVVGSLLTALIAGAVTAAMAPAGPQQQSFATVWGNSTATAAQTIRGIPVSGAIMAEAGDGLSFGGTTYGYEVAATIDSIQAEDAAGLALLVNTPGGSINGSRAIADAVERYQARTGKKVVAYVRGMSASGGMYAMAGADKIVADHGSLIGSIGVIMGPLTHFKDVVSLGSTALEPGVTTKGGLTQEYLTQGEGKDFGNPFRAMSAKERQLMMTGLANEYGAFVDWVAKHRGIPARTIRADIGAHIYDGKQAIAHKLIDAQLGQDEAFRDMASVMGVDAAQARVVLPREPGLMEQLLGAEARVYGYQAALPAGAKPTSVLCTGALQPMLWHGSVKSACG